LGTCHPCATTHPRNLAQPDRDCARRGLHEPEPFRSCFPECRRCDGVPRYVIAFGVPCQTTSCARKEKGQPRRFSRDRAQPVAVLRLTILATYKVGDLLTYTGGLHHFAEAVWTAHSQNCATWEARDSRSRTLKVISERYLGDESARARFLREARAAASVRHPNVASVFHLGRTGRSYFYAMEFAGGETLEKLVKRSGRLEVKLALESQRRLRPVWLRSTSRIWSIGISSQATSS
jgi:hypothetical protein